MPRSTAGRQALLPAEALTGLGVWALDPLGEQVQGGACNHVPAVLLPAGGEVPQPVGASALHHGVLGGQELHAVLHGVDPCEAAASVRLEPPRSALPLWGTARKRRALLCEGLVRPPPDWMPKFETLER